MNIDSLNRSDIPKLHSLQPDGWTPIVPYYEFYIAADYCNPVKCVIDNRIAGIGSSIEHCGTGWLAHVIVHDDFRKQGIGTRITASLMAHLLKNRHVSSIHLVATPMGEPLYRRLGFERMSEYVFFRGGKTSEDTGTPIHAYEPRFKAAGLLMDREATSEDRSKLLEPHWTQGRFTTDKGKLTGFYLPALGEGYILATSPACGLALLRRKHSKGDPGVVPEENAPAIACLKASGFSEYRRGIRMAYGQHLPWHPEWIFGRVGGNLG